MKKILAIILIILFAPITFGLCTLNGKFCYHGHCSDVIPFWGGLIQGFLLDLYCIGMLAFGFFIMKLLMDDDE